jgi:hypothetical protein
MGDEDGERTGEQAMGKAARAAAGAVVLVGALVAVAGSAAGADGGGDGLGPGPCALEPVIGVPDALSGDGRFGVDGGQGEQPVQRVDMATGARVDVAPGAASDAARAAIDGDGDRVAFSSDQDLTGENPERELEVFLADLTADTVEQLTDLDDLDTADVQISADGEHVAFLAGDATLSDVDGEGTYAAYHADVEAGSVDVVSEEGARVKSLDLATGGGHVVYAEVHHFVTDHLEAGAWLVDLADASRVAVPDDYVRSPQVSADGGVVAWLAPRGGEGGSWDAVLAWDVEAETTTALSDTIPGGPQTSTVVELADDGSSLLFNGPDATLARLDRGGAGVSLFGASYGRWSKTSVGATVASDDLRTVLFLAAVGPNTTGVPDNIPGYRPVRARCGAELFVDTARASATWARWSGLSNGYADGTFRESDPISRQAMAAMLHRFAGSPPLTAGSTGFPDVGAGNPFRGEIRWARQQGLMYGYPDGTFRPVNPVSNQALASLAYRTAGEPDVSADVPTIVEQLTDVGPNNDHVEGITWWVRSFDDPYYPVQTQFSPLAPATRGVTVWALYQVSFMAGR